MNEEGISSWLGIPLLSSLMAYALPAILKNIGGRKMTELEKAFAHLLGLVLKKYEALEKEAEELRKRPTREEYDQQVKDYLKLQDELHVAKREVRELMSKAFKGKRK
jgi:hypothetical protein